VIRALFFLVLPRRRRAWSKLAPAVFFPLVIFLGGLAESVAAQSKEPTLEVATREVTPFVFQENGRLTGFSIELWQEIAKQMNVKCRFIMKPTVKELLDSVNSREAELSISAISITAARELQWDFSQPMFDAGLQILAPVQSSQGNVIKYAVGECTSVEYLRQHNVDAAEYAKVEDAFQALEQAQVDAVVYDAPVLLYYASHQGKNKFQTVGTIFRKESYGIAFPPNSPYRKPTNEALLKLKENGTYDQLYQKWFGGPAS
jgi:ABC-type amino acid transport substrate-binding protein